MSIERNFTKFINIRCSFYGQNIMFAISTKKDLFEIGNINISLYNPKQVDTLFNELIAMYLIINYLKLDESIVF